MKELPRDPYAFQARVFGALCDDLFDIASGKSAKCERTNAIRQVSISTRESALPNKRADSNH